MAQNMPVTKPGINNVSIVPNLDYITQNNKTIIGTYRLESNFSRLTAILCTCLSWDFITEINKDFLWYTTKHGMSKAVVWIEYLFISKARTFYHNRWTG